MILDPTPAAAPAAPAVPVNPAAPSDPRRGRPPNLPIGEATALAPAEAGSATPNLAPEPPADGGSARVQQTLTRGIERRVSHRGGVDLASSAGSALPRFPQVRPCRVGKSNDASSAAETHPGRVGGTHRSTGR